MFQLFDTLSQKKSPFQPLRDKRVSLYCCGVTPYNSVHIGHTRTFFSFDLLHRVLLDQGYEVDWARNITDVDDKIIQRAQKEGVTTHALVDRYVAEQDECLTLFRLDKPQHEPKVTESIADITALIEDLIQKGMAYTSASGVYYRVRRFGGYGKLSKNRIDDLVSGARIEVDESKEDALDFALWKFAKPGEISWPSPWGDGRPGWHIECSGMVKKLFGDSIDIHCGGRDLIFPHHEAEIAQSEGATGQPLAQHWLHFGMMTLDGEKMSKSTNHFVSIADFLKKYPAEVLRLVFLSTTYAQPLDFRFSLADETLRKLARMYRFVGLVDACQSGRTPGTLPEHPQAIFSKLPDLVPAMRAALADDLNSPAALAVFFEFLRDVNTGLTALEKAGHELCAADRSVLDVHWPQFRHWMAETMNLLVSTPADFFNELRRFSNASELSPEDVESRLVARREARDSKDWAQADAIRKELLEQGILIQDTPTGTRWTVQI